MHPERWTDDPHELHPEGVPSEVDVFFTSLEVSYMLAALFMLDREQCIPQSLFNDAPFCEVMEKVRLVFTDDNLTWDVEGVKQ